MITEARRLGATDYIVKGEISERDFIIKSSCSEREMI
jgi:hypothetical protein